MINTLIELVQKYRNGERSSRQPGTVKTGVGQMLQITLAFEGSSSLDETLFEGYSDDEILAMIETEDMVRKTKALLE